MTAYQAERVYYTEPDGDDSWVNVADRAVTVDEAQLPFIETDPSVVVKAREIKARDLAIIMSYLMDDGSERVDSYLVTYQHDDTGILVPSQLVESAPELWVTQRLHYLVSDLTPGEFEQFTLPNTLKYIKSAST
jgi:hypothetical protein